MSIYLGEEEQAIEGKQGTPVRSVFHCKQPLPKLGMRVKLLKSWIRSNSNNSKSTLQKETPAPKHSTKRNKLKVSVDIRSKMASTQPNNFYFPHFPPPSPHQFAPPPPPQHGHPPPPFHPFAPPPPPHRRPPPPPPFHPIIAPPPPAHGHRPPPPPFHPIIAPPPPHVDPHPGPRPPSPSPNNHPIVIVVVFVSLGGILFLSLLAFALFCFIKKRKKKTQETDVIHIDEHKKVKETIISGPFGPKSVVISVEDDVHINEDIIKSEKLGHARGGLHTNSPDAQDSPTSRTNNEVVTTSSGFAHDDQHHHQLEHKS